MKIPESEPERVLAAVISLSPSIIVFMVPSLDTTYISASMVREVARYGGDIAGLVHPSVAEALQGAYTWSKERVVESGPLASADQSQPCLITSQGPGTSFEFALTLVRRLRGAEVERAVMGPLNLRTFTARTVGVESPGGPAGLTNRVSFQVVKRTSVP